MASPAARGFAAVAGAPTEGGAAAAATAGGAGGDAAVVAAAEAPLGEAVAACVYLSWYTHLGARGIKKKNKRKTSDVSTTY